MISDPSINVSEVLKNNTSINQTVCRVRHHRNSKPFNGKSTQCFLVSYRNQLPSEKEEDHR